jgi:SAM-dependent methyltransferase
MSDSSAKRTYSNFGLLRSWRQLRHRLAARSDIDATVALHLDRLRRDEGRMAEALGRPVEDLDVFELGPGQQMTRAHYFGLKNRVTVVDLDVVPTGVNPIDYLRVWKTNGFGRFAKTAGRKLLLLDRSSRLAWQRALGADRFTTPRFIQADICTEAPEKEAFDLAVTWSVFEHLPDSDSALASIVDALRPGGALYIGIHSYTSHTGHHDIRAFAGQERELPLWGHLRDETKDSIEPSAWCNEWRLADWRELFARRCPGYVEYRENYGEEWLREQMTPELRAELADYTDEELYTIDVFYAWRKPLEPEG